MRLIPQRLTFLCLLLVVSCDSRGESRETSHKPASKVEAPPRTTVDTPTTVRQDPFVKEAEFLTRGFEMKLKGELMAAMKKGGPDAAIAVCSERAQAIGNEMSKFGLRVRRVGTRIRNPKNLPDDHDQRAMQVLSAESPTYHLAEPPRYYRAIFAKPLCLSCHGQQHELAPGVEGQLAKLYPQDNAIGYAAGDLRGAFVVEKKPDIP